jgi:SagB-type dehydrogenase family enzyme
MIHVDDFHGRTSYRRNQVPEVLSCGPPVFKHYPDHLPRIVLPRPETLPAESFWDVVAHRRSGRDYASSALARQDLLLLLWATQGITQPGRLPMRATPSAGATYPIETYVAASRVDGLTPGLYHWQLPDEVLVALREDEAIGRRVAAACMGQAMCQRAACTFLWTAVFPRMTERYGQRGVRYVYLDAGHVGQNLQLAATALALASCNIGALFDDEVNELLGVDGEEESIVYAASVGHPG